MDHRKLQEDVEAGNLSPLRAYIALRKHLDDLNKSLEVIKEQAIKEFSQVYGGKECNLYGATVAKHQGGRYDYKHIQRWVDANAKLKTIEDEAKQAYAAATSNKGEQLVDEETGEYIEPAMYKSNAESITVKFD